MPADGKPQVFQTKNISDPPAMAGSKLVRSDKGGPAVETL